MTTNLKNPCSLNHEHSHWPLTLKLLGGHPFLVFLTCLLQVTDGGEPYQQTSLVQVRITVQDVNNIAPEFTQESYTEYIVVNEPPGKYWPLIGQ